MCDGGGIAALDALAKSGIKEESGRLEKEIFSFHAAFSCFCLFWHGKSASLHSYGGIDIQIVGAFVFFS